MSSVPKQLGLHTFDFFVGSTNLSEIKPLSNSSYSLISAESRNRIWIDTLNDGERAVFKMYHFRGPISWQREKYFRFRVQREFELLTYLCEFNIPCSIPVYWSYGYCPGFGRCELLVTKYLPQTQTLHKLIEQLKPKEGDSELCNLYRTVRKMHQHGLYHGALYPTNVLISNDNSEKINSYIIDLPNGMVFSRDISFSRMATFDLLNLSTKLRDTFGLDSCLPYFSAYGLSGRGLDKMMDTLARYYPTKHTRNRLRAEFSARELVSKYFPLRNRILETPEAHLNKVS